MNKRQTIYNWRWWLVSPFVIVVISIVSIPKVIIFILEKIICLVEVINLWDKQVGFYSGNKLYEWVHGTKGNKHED